MQALRKVGKVVVGGCALYTFFDKVGHPAVVVGNSMQPTLEGGDARWWKRDFVWLSTRDLYHCSPGTILVFTSPRDKDTQHIKRVTAVEGEIRSPTYHPEWKTKVLKGHYWMEGDNPEHRNDSNLYGPVSCSLVSGRATHIIWPPHRWRRL
ncbi:CRE-IMMP-2 protein [Caenorhabditis remanei]|uniref:Mitochondrial inner membrane protease subunit 2 n=1 Tax=Caenorhabditis remanei TaxID=31234 RepID=E3MXV8_CAERE|nr:CRE-IMMP-2 protein [Caenorhabditis remanei]